MVKLKVLKVGDNVIARVSFNFQNQKIVKLKTEGTIGKTLSDYYISVRCLGGSIIKVAYSGLSTIATDWKLKKR